jgi:hypothetical protein
VRPFEGVGGAGDTPRQHGQTETVISSAPGTGLAIKATTEVIP